jgi:hypothetical protein
MAQKGGTITFDKGNPVWPAAMFQKTTCQVSWSVNTGYIYSNLEFSLYNGKTRISYTAFPTMPPPSPQSGSANIPGPGTYYWEVILTTIDAATMLPDTVKLTSGTKTY